MKINFPTNFSIPIYKAAEGEPTDTFLLLLQSSATRLADYVCLRSEEEEEAA
jgi:hypothetical protein